MRDSLQHQQGSTISSKEIFSLINQGTQLDILLQALTAWVGERLPDALVSVMVYDAETNTLSLHPNGDFSQEYVAALQNVAVTALTGTCGAAAATHQLVISSDLSTDPKWQPFFQYANSEGLAACWSTPISSEGLLFGTFATYYRTAKSPTKQDIVLIERAASILASAIEQQNARSLHQKLNERYSSLFNNHPDCVYEMDLEGRIVSANTRVLKLANTTAEEVNGLHFSTFVSKPYQARAVAAFNDATRGNTPTHFELEVKTNDGKTHWMEITNLPITLHNKVSGVFGIGRDISAQHLNKDPVTGLPKRRVFEKQLVNQIQQSKPLHKALAVLSIDLDDFSAINESIGFHNADTVLALVGQRLTTLLTDDDLASRFAADEFMVLLRDCNSSRSPIEIAEQFLTALAVPFEVNGHSVYVTASIGITILLPSDGDTQAPTAAMQLLREADLAAAEAKHQGKNTWTFYRGADTGGFSEFAMLRQELQTAILKSQFSLFYQPLVYSTSYSQHGVEALIRWNHPTRGMLSPDTFISVAEQTGQIVAIGRWVLHQACKDIVSYNRKYGTSAAVSVNLSPLQFRRNGFVEEVINALQESQLAPNLLTLEITENLLVKGADEATDILKQIRALGVKVAIDDFGTGYSSLSYLRHLPADYIKIDKSFIRDIDCDSKNRAITAALIQMAQQLSLQVVAEGVETKAQAELLASLQCNLLQGFYFARPQQLASLADGVSEPL